MSAELIKVFKLFYRNSATNVQIYCMIAILYFLIKVNVLNENKPKNSELTALAFCALIRLSVQNSFG